jgi:ribosomal protein S14
MKQVRYFNDINKIKLFKKKELVQLLIKIFYLITSSALKWVLIATGYIKFNYFKTKLKKFCVFSGRSKGVSSKFKVSRIVLRELSSKGYFMGLKKASW